MKKPFLFLVSLLVSIPVFALQSEDRSDVGASESNEKLEVQKKLYVPWRKLNLFELHKKTLEEVVNEQNEEKSEPQFSSQELEQEGVSDE